MMEHVHVELMRAKAVEVAARMTLPAVYEDDGTVDHEITIDLLLLDAEQILAWIMRERVTVGSEEES